MVARAEASCLIPPRTLTDCDDGDGHDGVGNDSDEDNDYLPNFKTRPGIVRQRLKVGTFFDDDVF